MHTPKVTDTPPSLSSYGWNPSFAAAFQNLALPNLVPARVLADYGSMLKVATPAAMSAELAGQLLHNNGKGSSENLPKVGDWVAIQTFETESAIIEAVLPRASEIARKAKGDKTVKQVMASNVDIAFVLQSMDADFNPERLQRYLLQLRASNVEPIVVLNKADSSDAVDTYVAQVIRLGVRHIVCSALTGAGVDEIMAAIPSGKTAVLLGSSGVGKSTLTNRLIGSNTQKTQAVRVKDAKGRHTTTHRELFILDSGGMLIDTPGIRELQLWGVEDEMGETFEDITNLEAACDYSNCKHGVREHGCAVQTALSDGQLDPAHYRNYLKLQHELRALGARIKPLASRHKKKSNQRTYDDSEDY